LHAIQIEQARNLFMGFSGLALRPTLGVWNQAGSKGDGTTND